MAKQLNVNLGFTADTSKAKAQLQDLQKQLTNLVNSPSKMNGSISDQIWEATRAAAELKTHLESATNASTGSLDFTKLNDSLKASGKSLSDYGEKLVKMGPDGQKAFMSLAQSVANAEVPIRRSNALLSEMWVTMKNTARWQLSSSILHGFMGALSSAYGYAQDLNESLNNIRIVTGYSSEQMAQFAEQANKAAKALSTTTTEYTNASLIYYQQGLADEEVRQRTDITIKMANAAGESAEKVSDQLTAVWNNFYDGTQSLEHYADVMTALGAATASSTDEIAGGLEKFAAIADTIGLSYEYAASALATITANTRQSEEVVGTALKTIFARIQGLNLGETLEDGVTLNKYSEALQKVGISIFDAAGGLKDMDTILDEMGAKWSTLNTAQQTALAQTVAGVRQYNQLISLMDNWDSGDGDSFQANLDTARNADGALQEQSDIYAESWEAASDRVRAALEGIYSTLIDDDAFISILNTIEKIISYIDNLIDSVGGLSGVLTTVGALLTKVFSAQISQSISNMAYSMKMMSAKGRQSVADEKTKFIDDAAGIITGGDYNSKEEETTAKTLQSQLTLQKELIENSGRMSEHELKTNQMLLDRVKIMGQQQIQAAKQLDIAKQQTGELNFQAKTQIANKGLANNKSVEEIKKASAEFSQLEIKLRKGIQVKTNLPEMLKKAAAEGQTTEQKIDLIVKQANKLGDGKLNNFIKNLDKAQFEGDELENTLTQIIARVNNFNDTQTSKMLDLGVDEQTVDALNSSLYDTAEAQMNLDRATTSTGEAVKKSSENIKNAQGVQKTWADNLVTCANSALSFISALQMIGGIVDTLQDPNMTGWEKFLSIGSTLLMMVPMLVSAFTGLSAIMPGVAASSAGAAAGIGGTGVAAGAATGPVAGFGVALNAALGPIGWVALALTALIAVFAVIVTSMDTASEKAQKNFDKMAADAQHAADELSSAKDAYADLQDTIESYQDARSKIDDLTEGTEEFKQAVIEANEHARKLIETYGVASNFNADTGLIEINQDDLDKAMEKQQQALENARINNAAAQTNKLMAQNDLSNAKMVEKNDVGYWERVGQTIGDNVAIGTMAGMAAGGGVFSWATTIAGAIAGAATSFIEAGTTIADQNSTNEAQIDALESLQEAYIQNGGNLELAMASLGESERSLIESLGVTDSELDKLCSEVSANTAAILQNNKEIVDSNFADNETYANSKYKDELNTVLATDLDAETKRLYEEKWQDSSEYGGGSGITDKEAQKAYAEMMGYTWVGNEGGNNGTYSKGDGSADFTVSDETARRALAQREAMELLEQSVEGYNDALMRVAETGNQFGKNTGDLMVRMAGGLGADFSDAAQDQIDALNKALVDAAGTDGALTDAEALTIISDEDAQKLGYDNALDYCQALQNSIDGYNANMDQITNRLSDSISQGFTEIDGLTLDMAQSMSTNLTQAFNMAGSEAANALDDIFVAAGEDADELSTLLEGVDWGDPNAVAKLNAEIDEQGLAVDTTSAAWLAYVNAMSAAGQAIGGVDNQFANLRATMADVKDIAGELEMGAVISEEDYQRLMEINPAIKELFGVAAEGYKFLGDQGTLTDMLTGNFEQSLEGAKAQYEELSELGKYLNDSTNYFDEDNNQNFSKDRHVAMIADQMTDDTGRDMDAALAYFGVSKESLQEASDYIKQYTNADTGEFDQDLADADENFDQSQYDAYLEYLNNFYNQLDSLQEQYEAGKFDSQQAEELWASEMCQGIKELSDAYAEGAISAETYMKYQEQILNADLSSIGNVKDSLALGEELTAEQEDYLDKLEEQWEFLGDIADRGSQEYLEALDTIEDAMHQIKINSKFDEIESIDIDVNADTDKFEDALDKVTDLKREIVIEVVADATDTFEMIDAQLDRINGAAAQIGKNYTITRDQIASVADAFPGILENAKVTADGTIQLSKAEADAAIARAQTEAQASAESAKAEIQAKIAVLEAKKQANLTIIQGAQAVMASEVTAAGESGTAQTEIEAAITAAKEAENQLQAMNKADEANAEIDSSNTAAEAEAHNANQSSIAWDQAFEQMAANAVAAANEMIKAANAAGAANAAASGQSFSGASLIGGSNYTGSSGGISVEASTAEASGEYENTAGDGNTSEYDALQALLANYDGSEGTNAKIQAIIDSLTAENAAIDDAISTLQGQILDIDSNLVEIDNRVEGVESGVGGALDNKGGGSGGKDKEEEKLEHLEDETDIYADIDAQIDEINHKLEQQKKITENSEGEEKLESLKKEKELLDQLNGKYEEKKALAQETLQTQKDLLSQKVPGLKFSGDTILNQVEVLQGMVTELNELADIINAETDATTKAAYQKQYDDLKEQYEAIKKLLLQYEETLALLREIEGTITDNNYEAQGKLTVDEGGSADGEAQQTLEDIQKENYEKLTKQLEINLSFDDNQLKLIEHYLEAIADDFYQMGEAAALTSSKVSNLTGKLSSYEDFYNSLQGANISQEDLIAGMQDSADGIIDTLNELIALDKEMMEFYSNTLDAAAEELSYFTDQLSHHTEVLDHYRNIVEMINGEFDYDTIGIILEGSATTAKSELDAATANYEMLLSEKAALEASLAMAPDEAARELYEKELRAITEACNEAEAEMLDKTEAWAEAMKAVLENTMAKAAHEMEMALTEGMGFDYISSQMDRLSSYADEVLTKTNQMYETQKLINTAQQAIDKTTNNAAKVRLKNYQDEISALQKKNELSKFELELAQAQYDVLLAEIALEEAQNAKATVRLQRDSEGNFGYVYTADKEAVSQAEQELADAQNALYNIGLEGANEYGQKMQELKRETAEALIELEEMRAAGEIATEEQYQAMKDAILQDAYRKYTLYSNNYTKALSADASVQKEAWVDEFVTMGETADKWMQDVTSYVEDCEIAYSEWRQTVQSESDIINNVLNHTEREVKDVTDANEALKNKVVHEVIPAIQRELEQVRAATSAYANQRSAIQQLISYYQQLAAAIYQAVAAQNALAGASSSAGSSSNGSTTRDDFDFSIDYSALAAKEYAEGNMDKYKQALADRDYKISQGYSDYGVTNEMLNAYLTSGGTLGDGEYFTDVDWDKYGYATGGYTGAWGPDGRIAMVHEKELILNKDDTLNFLSGIEMLRNISKSIDLDSMRNRMPAYSTLPFYDTQPVKEALEQQVSIQASFPAVTDRYEIEEAFNNLINTASQYANRKKL